MSSKVANHTCVFFPSFKEKGYSAKKTSEGWMVKSVFKDIGGGGWGGGENFLEIIIDLVETC